MKKYLSMQTIIKNASESLFRTFIKDITLFENQEASEESYKYILILKVKNNPLCKEVRYFIDKEDYDYLKLYYDTLERIRKVEQK